MVVTIHRIWFGPRRMPARYVEYGEKWRTLGYELQEWDYGNLPELRNQLLFDRCGKTWGGIAGAGKQSSAVQVQQADIAAYELIWRFGGVYANCDLEPLKPVDDLLNRREWAAASPNRGSVSNAIIGGIARDTFWGFVIDLLPRFVATRPLKPMNQQTGPSLLTEAARLRPGELTVYPSEWFFPYGYADMRREGGVFPDAYTEHHWGHATADADLWPGGRDSMVAQKPGWLSAARLGQLRKLL